MTKVEGITDIQTDIDARSCSFKVTEPDLDYKAKLEELAKDNEHIAGYEIVNAG